LASSGKPSQSLRRYQVRRSSASSLISDSCIDPTSVAQFSLSALKSSHAVLGEDDQYHMYHMSSRALTAAKRRGETRLIDYWSGRPVVSIELLPYVIVKNIRRPLLLTHPPIDLPRQEHWLRTPPPYLLDEGRRMLANYHKSQAHSCMTPGNL
jgi:hypothetical protein